MKIRILWAAAVFVPVILTAQTPPSPPTNPTPQTKDSTIRDSTTRIPADTTKAPPKNPTSGSNAGTTMSGTSTGVSTDVNSMSGAPSTIAGAPSTQTRPRNSVAGLTGPQFLALQQELRDRKCGVSRVTGRLDAATRTAIRACAKKMGVANNAAAVLVAFDIGYGASDVGLPSPSGGKKLED
jgi:hypothetical protein